MRVLSLHQLLVGFLCLAASSWSAIAQEEGDAAAVATPLVKSQRAIIRSCSG